MGKLDLLRRTGKYEYVNALVRGQIGNLLRLHEYEAILGCTRPSDLVQVLKNTSYRQLLERAEPSSFAGLKEPLTSAISRTIDTLIESSPDDAKAILQNYRFVLESRSLVNLLITRIKQDVIAEAGIVPLGAIPTTYYEQSASRNTEPTLVLQPPGLDTIISESLEIARSYKCTAPLLRIIPLFAMRFFDNAVFSSQDQTPMRRLVTSTVDGASLEMIITSLLCQIEPRIFSNWLGVEDLRELALKIRDIDQLMAWLTNSRYGTCAEEDSDHIADVLRYKLAYCMMSHEAHLALAGYPFRVSTIVAGIVLKLMEIRNIRLAIAGASGQLKRATALRLMVMP